MIRVLCQFGDSPGWERRDDELRRSLTASGQCLVTSATAIDSDAALDAADVVLFAGSSGPPRCEQVERVDAFVRRGGGLVCLAGALVQDGIVDCVRDLLGGSPGRLTDRAEVIGHVVDGEHPIVTRLDPSFPMEDRWWLADQTPDDAADLLCTRWHYRDYSLAHVRPHGRGQIVVLAASGVPGATAQQAFQRLLLRSVRYAAGQRPRSPVGVALVGYGAIGRAHAEAIEAVPGLRYAAVCDRNPSRQAEAQVLYPGVRGCGDLADVARDAGVDVAIVSTPPNTHAQVAAALLEAGKHVVLEKPFCLTTGEADRLIALAAGQARSLTVYQNRRWDPDYLAIRQAVASGTLGELFHVETFIGGYEHPCDYWHSHEPISGGVFYDWGSHYVDWLLGLIPGSVVRVTASAHKRVWHDVTNADQARVQLRFSGGEEAEFLHSDVAAALKPKWYVLGTRGALVADWRHTVIQSREWTGDLREERLAPAEALPRVTVHRRDPSGAIHQETLALPPGASYPFHRNLADHLLDGDPLAVDPGEARRTVAVLAAAQHSATHDAEPVYLDC
jgi:predicted dehydrogenase